MTQSHSEDSHSAAHRQSFTATASIVAAGTATSRILGFLRDIMVASYFDRTATDAFNVAYRLPNLFRRLFGEGALTVSFIPVLTDFVKNDDKQGARELVSSVFTMLFAILSVITFFGIVFPQWFIDPLTSGAGYTSIAGKVELTVHQARIIFIYIMLVSFYAFFMGILNTLKIFWLPAVAPALFNLSMIVGMLFFRHTFPISSDILAWSTIVGGCLQMGVLIPSVVKSGLFPKIKKWWGNPAVKKVLRAMGPSILGLSVMQIGVIINTFFASTLEEGSISWISWADRILELPLSLFAVSVGTAALPSLAGLWSRGDKKGMRETSVHSLRLAFFMAFPCAAGVFVLSKPIIYTLFQHGKFRPYDTEMTAAILQVYGIQMIFAAGVRVLAPTFYAMKNTWLPALSAAISLIIHIIVASQLIKFMGVVGLTTSSVLSSLINFSILVYSYRFTGEKLHLEEILPTILKFVGGCLALAGAARVYPVLHHFFGEGGIGRVISLALTIALAGSAYVAVCWFLKVRELTESVDGFKRKLGRKFNRVKI